MIFNECEPGTFPEKQEEEWVQDEFSEKNENNLNGKPLREFFTNHLTNDEANLVPLNSQFGKDHCETQDKRSEEMMELGREVEDMLESAKKLQRRMSEEVGAEEVVGEEAGGEEGGGGATGGEDEVKASMAAIERMDAILRAKAGEERRAKLWRMRAEEKSRDILRGLPCVKMSTGVRINSEEFLRLLEEVEETECELGGVEKVKEGTPGDEDENVGQGKKEEKKEKEEKKNSEWRKKKNLKFVEKNIQLAKCGGGTLSLTDEEKLRIEKLLVEAEDPSGENPSLEEGFPRPGSALTTPLYAMDSETRSALSRIDQQLQVVAKAQGAVSLQEGSQEKEDEKKRGSRLAEINKLLEEMKSVCEEEISPLSEEEILSLVEQSKRSLEEKEEGGWREENLVSELVSNAKLLMPKFKYRFDNR